MGASVETPTNPLCLSPSWPAIVEQLQPPEPVGFGTRIGKRKAAPSGAAFQVHSGLARGRHHEVKGGLGKLQ